MFAMLVFAGMIMILILAGFLALAAIVCWIYGIILCLRASLVLFIICFFLHVPFVIFGLVKLVCGEDLAMLIADKTGI